MNTYNTAFPASQGWRLWPSRNKNQAYSLHETQFNRNLFGRFADHDGKPLQVLDGDNGIGEHL